MEDRAVPQAGAARDSHSTTHSHAHTTHRAQEQRVGHRSRAHNHSTTAKAQRQGHTGAGHTTHMQKKEQVRTQSDIEVCYSSSVEHKGTDHTVTPNHSTCSPSERTWHKASEPALCPLLRAGGARHRRRYYPDPKCNAGRGRRGFFADKIKKNLTISLRKAGRRLGNGPETEN